MPTQRSIRLGDKDVARIGLGTNRLTDDPAGINFVREAVAAGIAHIDTAHAYTGGQSEAAIGQALASEFRDCVVATKGGLRPGEGRPDALRKQLEESLSRLQTRAIALYYLHRVDPETPLEESLGVVKEYRDAGKVRYVGVSEVSVEQVERARRVVPIVAVQNRYNIADRKHDDVVDHCAREGLVFVPFSPLRGQPPAAVAGIARRHGATTVQVVLAWLLRRSPAMLPIPGTLSAAHARENLGALDVELTESEFAELSQATTTVTSEPR